MAAPQDNDELKALRARAYGPEADIHRDPQALERLRELEDAARPRYQPIVDVETPPISTREQLPEIIVDEDEPHRLAKDRARMVLGLAQRAWARLRRLRRSTVLILLGMAVLVAGMVVTLILVQRVQTDPLQVGAVQVARLSVDPSYQVPKVFLAGTEDETAYAFQEFRGLRAVVTKGGFFRGSGGDNCLSLFSASDITDPDSDSFQGQIFGGCEAGKFPATITFVTDMEGFPAELREAFAEPTALQFVYDRENREVVVFADQ